MIPGQLYGKDRENRSFRAVNEPILPAKTV
jgi:hypothetical protein